MVEEGIRARLMEIEIRMNRMAVAIDEMKVVQMNQIAEMRAIIMASYGGNMTVYPTNMINSGNSGGNPYDAPIGNKGHNEETRSMVMHGSEKPLRMQCSSKKGKEPANVITLEKRKRNPPRQYTPLPRPLSQLFPMLLEGRLVAKEVPRESPPKFNGFDLNKSCEYHMGEKGHNVDNCLVLKNKVQNLIDRGMLDFKEAGPAPEPLPN